MQQRLLIHWVLQALAEFSQYPAQKWMTTTGWLHTVSVPFDRNLLSASISANILQIVVTAYPANFSFDL